MMSEENHRRFTRVHPEVEVEIAHLEYGILPTRTRDVSMRGVALEGCQDLPVGTECEVTFYLGGRLSGKRIEARSRLVRIENGVAAFEFLEIRGIDSFEHLRNLVFYNARIGDPVDDELRDSLGLRLSSRFEEVSS